MPERRGPVENPRRRDQRRSYEVQKSISHAIDGRHVGTAGGDERQALTMTSADEDSSEEASLFGQRRNGGAQQVHAAVAGPLIDRGVMLAEQKSARNVAIAAIDQIAVLRNQAFAMAAIEGGNPVSRQTRPPVMHDVQIIEQE